MSGDNKIIQVALDGLENILKVGELDKPMTEGVNRMALYIEECGGMEKIHQLQIHDNVEIYKKAYTIIDKYFNDDEEDTGLAPDVDQATGQFAFPSGDGMMNMPQVSQRFSFESS